MATLPVLYNVISDGGVFTITYAGGGKVAFQINRPDPPPPDVNSVLRVAAAIVNEATLVTDRGLAAQFQQLAETLLNTQASRIGGYLATAGETAAVAAR